MKSRNLSFKYECVEVSNCTLSNMSSTDIIKVCFVQVIFNWVHFEAVEETLTAFSLVKIMHFFHITGVLQVQDLL